MEFIDLRSDTVSHPTQAMREAMASAPVGDDVYGEDPTVNALQDYAAELLGKEAALFMPSATMCNVAAALTHCRRGDEMIVSKKAHMFVYEQGGASQLGGVSMHPLELSEDGTIPLKSIEAAVRSDDIHFPRTALLCLENTSDGMPLTPYYTNQVGDIAKRRGLKLHIDGARLFNAAAALNVSPSTLVAPADSVQICLSKGLCAPLGALLAGSNEFIKQALRTRKVLGGGMRQVGIVAAAGLIALRDMRERLMDDHRNAERLASGLNAIKGVSVVPANPRTNMVFFSIPESVNSKDFIAALRAQNILLRGGPNFRAVIHYWIKPNHVDQVIDAIQQFMDQHPI